MQATAARAPSQPALAPVPGSQKALSQSQPLGLGGREGVCVCGACSFESRCPPLLGPVLSCPIQPGTSAICAPLLLSPRARLPFPSFSAVLIEHTLSPSLGCVTSGADGFISGVWGPPLPRRPLPTQGCSFWDLVLGSLDALVLTQAWRLAATLRLTLGHFILPHRLWPGPRIRLPKAERPRSMPFQPLLCPLPHPLPAPHLQRRWSF